MTEPWDNAPAPNAARLAASPATGATAVSLPATATYGIFSPILLPTNNRIDLQCDGATIVALAPMAGMLQEATPGNFFATEGSTVEGGLIFGNTTSLAAPTVAGGTSPSADAHAHNHTGTATFGTGAVTSGTITFASAYASWDHCRVTSQSALSGLAYSYTLAAITVTASSLTGAKIDYDCEGY